MHIVEKVFKGEDFIVVGFARMQRDPSLRLVARDEDPGRRSVCGGALGDLASPENICRGLCLNCSRRAHLDGDKRLDLRASSRGKNFQFTAKIADAFAHSTQANAQRFA